MAKPFQVHRELVIPAEDPGEISLALHVLTVASQVNIPAQREGGRLTENQNRAPLELTRRESFLLYTLVHNCGCQWQLNIQEL